MVDVQSYSGQEIWGRTDYMTDIELENAGDKTYLSALLRQGESGRAACFILLRQNLPGQNIPSALQIVQQEKSAVIGGALTV
jgi:hypothetical protein